jgi:predicted hydrocarbon binding protein
LKDVLEEKKGFFLDFETFAEMKRALEKTFASGATVIMATMAKPCGRRICKQIKERTKTKKEALDQLSELVSEQNWGELSFFDVDFGKGSGKATVKNSFEARKTVSKTPCCHFFANFIAGFISELFAKNVIVKEEKCAGKGDAQCEFRF